MEYRVGIIGLGYVGLPLAVASGERFSTVGFDINSKRIEELTEGLDRTLEVAGDELEASSYLSFTSNLGDLSNCNLYIVTVPTPVDENKKT